MQKQISPEVLTVLKGARCDGSKLFIEARLDRKLYSDTMKIIDLLGGKWTGKLGKGGHHAFDGDCADRIDEAVSAGAVTDFKKLFQFFETPAEVACKMVQALSWKPKLSVLEPSAGRGRIIHAILVLARQPALYCCELDPKNKEFLHREFDLSGGKFLADDFMALPVNCWFDRIVMNPPFRAGQDVKHVRKAFDHLNAGGEMVAIMSPAFDYRQDKLHSEFRDFIANTDSTVEPLPASSFKESGTEVNTVMVTIRK